MSYTLKDQQISGSGTGSFRPVGSPGSGRLRLATSFTPASSYTLTRVSVEVGVGSGAIGNAHLAIYSDTAGPPDTALGTATTAIDATTLAPFDNRTFQDFDFVGVALTLGTRYHIAFYGDGSDDGFGPDAGATWTTATASGESVYEYEGAWFEDVTDTQLAFKTYETTGAGNTAATQPPFRQPVPMRAGVRGLAKGKPFEFSKGPPVPPVVPFVTPNSPPAFVNHIPMRPGPMGLARGQVFAFATDTPVPPVPPTIFSTTTLPFVFTIPRVPMPGGVVLGTPFAFATSTPVARVSGTRRRNRLIT